MTGIHRISRIWNKLPTFSTILLGCASCAYGLPSNVCQAPATVPQNGTIVAQSSGVGVGNVSYFFLVSAGSIAVNGVVSPAGSYTQPGSGTGVIAAANVPVGSSFWVFCHTQDATGINSTYATITVAPPAVSAAATTDNGGEQALTAFQYTDSVGVNVHLHDGQTVYGTQFPLLMQNMLSSGIKHYRNSIDPYPNAAEYANAEALGLAGIKADWLLDSRLHASDINALYRNAPDSIDAFEGPNEDDADAGPVEAGFMSMVHDLVRSHPSTVNTPIYAPTVGSISTFPILGNLSAYITNGNMHDYYNPRYPETPAYGGEFYGCGPYGTMNFDICLAQINDPGQPVVSTETGFVSQQVPDIAIGRYLPRLLFMHAKANVPRTYLYELVDNINPLHYGLLNGDLSPKPQFTAISNLQKLFADNSFTTPGRLNFTLTGDLTNVNHVLFQKTDGTFLLAIWQGVASAAYPGTDYSVLQNVIYPAPQTVSIQTASNTGKATIYKLDDYGNMTSTGGNTSGNTTTVAVTDSITVVALHLR